MKGLPFVWSLSFDILEYFGGDASMEISQSLIFLSLFSFLSFVLSLPFSLYSTFVVEERHGFNKQTIGLYVKDKIKGILLFILLGLPITALLIYVMKNTGEFFYFYVWLALLVVQLVLLTIYPTLLAPLFNKFTPLQEGELKDKINALAKRNDFPLTKLFVVDGSTRSSHSNAYFYGFFKNKRIVLYDTLLKQTNNEEICAVLGHEIGHWKESHMPKMLLINQIHMFIILYIFGQFMHNNQLFSSFGFQDHPVLVGFILFTYIYAPVESVLQFFINALSRKHEFEADKFAVKQGYAKSLESALVKLQLENLSTMNPDSWYSTFHYSHPPLTERLKGIKIAAKKTK